MPTNAQLKREQLAETAMYAVGLFYTLIVTYVLLEPTTATAARAIAPTG